MGGNRETSPLAQGISTWQHLGIDFGKCNVIGKEKVGVWQNRMAIERDLIVALAQSQRVVQIHRTACRFPKHLPCMHTYCARIAHRGTLLS
jgi:hypothetical protein